MMKFSQDVAAALCARATARSRSPRTRRIRLGHRVILRALPRAPISQQVGMIMAALVKRALRLGGPAALVLVMALLRATGARAGTTFYDAPLVFARASYYTGTPPPISSFNFAGSEPNGGHAARSATSSAGPAYSFGTAARGRNGLQAITASAGDSAAGAQSYVRGVVSDPQNRPFVVAQVYFRAASSAAWPGQAGWEVIICGWNGTYGLVNTDGNGTVTGHGGLGCGERYFHSMARVRSENGGGYHAEHIVFENGEVARREISNNSVVQTSQDSWLVGEIVVPNGTELVVWIHATSSTHGSGATVITGGGGVGNDIAADVGSILVPHPDNPDASITWYAEEAPPGPPFGGFGPEDLAARGIDPQPFIDLGLFESEPPAPDVPCTGGTPLADVKLTMSEGDAVDRSKLHLQGKIALLPLPLDPPFDPIARGARVLLEDGSGDVLLDETLPGGAYDRTTSTGWRHKDGGKSWVYVRPTSAGIHHLVLKRTPRSENVYAFAADARLEGTPVPSPAELPLTATLVIDAPVAEDGQCGTVQFGAGPSTPACEVRKGPRLVCK